MIERSFLIYLVINAINIAKIYFTHKIISSIEYVVSQ